MSKHQKVNIYPIKTAEHPDFRKVPAEPTPEPHPTASEEAESELRPSVPIAVIVAEIVLIILAAISSVIFISALHTSHTFKYIHTEIPTALKQDSVFTASETLSEADIPMPIHIPVYYDFTAPVPESAPVDPSYFSETVFIGDSRTKGLIMYTSLSPYDFSSVGTNVKTVQTKAYIRMDDENGDPQSYTLFEAMEREAGNYRSVYIALGLNELGWSVDNFVISFRELITNIRNITDVPIYIQLIIPVTEYASNNTKFGVTNEKAAIFNERIRNECASLELFCLDPSSLFTLENGTLDPNHASDGIHLQRASYGILANYYSTHIVDLQAYDNTRTDSEAYEGDTIS